MFDDEAAGDQNYKIINILHREPLSITDVYFFFFHCKLKTF